MDCDNFHFSGHAVQRMFERRIGEQDVLRAIKNGKLIADYPDDYPYPSCLMLGFVEGSPIHVVVGLDSPTKACYIITVYQPDPELWDTDFMTRRQP